jgi:predicted ribosome quality control (RQC) complex YloA/Tae2 family protein
MKLAHLKALAERLGTFDYITRARRTEDNVIELTFKTPKPQHQPLNTNHTTPNTQDAYFFDMTRGHSLVFKAPSYRPLQGYNAPFDTLLHSLVSSAKILAVSVPDDDRILRLKLAPKSSYKDRTVTLQFEFTGKNTNALLLDENNVIIEALRHIDAERSFRVIRPGVEILPLPPRAHIESPEADAPTAATIDALLEENHRIRHARKLTQSKRSKAAAIRKQIAKFERLIDKLPDPETLLAQARTYRDTANIILANLHTIAPYDTQLNAYDFEGRPVTIPLPPDTPVGRMSEHYFTLAKRAEAKAANVHIEAENLRSKKRFYANILHAVEHARDTRELDLLVPKRAKAQRKKERLKEGELFWIEDFKVYVGRNSVENQHLLKIARANDLWMHVRGIPSSHVIIRTDKQTLPRSVLEAAAKLCVDFSIKQPGDYEVDYTKRKFVKIQEGSRVEYDKYHTIRVRKEGIEIRE